MTSVVYFLGAGFSKPLGLPTLAEFLQAAKDQHAKLPYIGPLLEYIEGLHKARSFFRSDLRNIEEVLSLFEADAFLNDPTLKERFKKLICDVFRQNTPHNTVEHKKTQNPSAP